MNNFNKMRVILIGLLFFSVFLVKISGLTTIKKYEIHVEKLGNNLYKMSYGINNWLVLSGPDGVLLSDSAPSSLAVSIKNKMTEMGHDQVKYIINTHWHHDHTGGNLTFGHGSVIIAHQSVRDHLSKKQTISLFSETFEALPAYALPDIGITAETIMFLNGEEVHLIPLKGGHSEGDLIVWFKNANVLHVGDLYVSGNFPAIDYEHGGDVRKLAENLSWIIQHMPRGVKIVSGHLNDGTIQELSKYQQIISKTIDIVRKKRMSGMKFQEMLRAKILEDYKEWGKHVTCDMWIQTILFSLDCQKKIE